MSTLHDRLRGHVDVLAELIGERNLLRPTAHDAARAYIERTLREAGLTPERQPYRVNGREAMNLEVVLPGRVPSKPTLVIGSHYDTAPGTPGADDNASAVAINLEIARSLAGAAPKRPVRIVFYDCEEPPFFGSQSMGSYQHARACHERNERLMGMICLESLGYFVRRVDPSLPRPPYLRKVDRMIGGRYVAVVSDLSSTRFWLRFVGVFATSGLFRFVPAALPRGTDAIGLSDHRAYWEHDYPAIMLTNTAFLRNPNYHLPTDRLATLDLPRMTRLAAQLQRTVRRLAGARRRRAS